MIKTTIYIAATPGAFDKELGDISAFIQRLNNCFIGKELFFLLVTPDYIERAANLSEGQNLKSELLAGSEVALFLFSETADSDTARDLDAALEISAKTGLPRVMAYFKSQTEGAIDSEGIKSLKDRLALEPNLYTNTYRDPQTLTLGLMMQIKQLKLQGMDLRLEHGKVYQGGEALLSFESAEIVAGYAELQRLKTERAELEGNFYAAKSKYAIAPEDKDLFESYREAARLRSEANRAIKEIEDRLYQIFDGMFEQTSTGMLSKRQVESYRLLELGKLEAARSILDFSEIMSDVRRDADKLGEAAKRAQVNVNELMQLKDINAAMGNWDNVETCFAEAVRVEEQHGLRRLATHEYLWHLYEQMQFDRAIELGEKLDLQLKALGSAANDVDRSTLYHRLGVVYMFSERMADAERAFLTALEIREARTEGDQLKIREEVADTYSNLGVLYKLTGRYDEAARNHYSALEIRKWLAERDPERHNEYLTHSYNNLGSLFNDMGNFEEAAENLKVSQSILEALVAENKKEEHKRVLSITFISLGISYEHIGRYDEAEEKYRSALELLGWLAEDNPEAYEPRIAYAYQSLGRMYTKQGRYAEAEEKLNASLHLFGKYMDYSEAFEVDIAYVYSEMGALYCEMKRYSEAENILNSAIRLFNKFVDAHASYETEIEKARKLLETIDNERNYVSQDMARAGLNQAEISVARLLLNGESRSYITRYLHISSAEYDKLEKSIRKKMNAAGGKDATIVAVAEKYKLTGRETDMLRYLGRSAGNDLIAAELHLSDATVRRHVRNLLDKLSINERQDVEGWLRDFSATV